MPQPLGNPKWRLCEQSGHFYGDWKSDYLFLAEEIAEALLSFREKA